MKKRIAIKVYVRLYLSHPEPPYPRVSKWDREAHLRALRRRGRVFDIEDLASIRLAVALGRADALSAADAARAYRVALRREVQQVERKTARLGGPILWRARGAS